MRDLTLPLAIFALIIVIADIILALTLCFSLPYHASRINYYPPFGSVVDIDTATLYCPCLNKYLEQLRGINNVRFIKLPKKNVTEETHIKKKKDDPVKNYPYVVSVQTSPPYPRLVCDGYIENQRGYIVVSHHCAESSELMMNMTVRSRSSYHSKFGQLHQVIVSYKVNYLYFLKIEPPLTASEISVGINVEMGGMAHQHPIPDDRVVFLHTWDVFENETTDIFKTYYYRPIDKCKQTQVHYCYSNKNFINASRHVLLDPCRKVVVGLKYDTVEGMDVVGYKLDCRKLYMGSCMDVESERGYCA